jgi:hypothetical protein
MSLVDHGRTQGEHGGTALSAEWDDRAWPRAFRLDSAYLARAISLSPDAPGAHAVSLLVDGWLGQEAVRAILIADPNVCTINDFGDRTACTRLAPRSYAVALTRLRADDPAYAGRRLYAITGAGMPDGLTLVMYPHGDRIHMTLGNEIIPLHQDDRMHR